MGIAARASVAEVPVVPDLGTIRYRDPHGRRSLWVGLDVGGTYVPRGLGPQGRDVWSANVAPAWALALTPRLAVGGRHALVWYDAENVRLSLHTHELEASAQLMQGATTSDRLSCGVELHSLDAIEVSRAGGGVDDFHVAGLDDVVLRLGYGREHDLGQHWQLDWDMQGRYAWVGPGTQRQVRASARLALAPLGASRIALEGVGFLVNRDATTFGMGLARTTLHEQAAVEYDWIFPAGVTLLARARLLSSLMSGEAPLYEARGESLRTPYGDLALGVRAVWD